MKTALLLIENGTRFMTANVKDIKENPSQKCGGLSFIVYYLSCHLSFPFKSSICFETLL